MFGICINYIVIPTFQAKKCSSFASFIPIPSRCLSAKEVGVRGLVPANIKNLKNKFLVYFEIIIFYNFFLFFFPPQKEQKSASDLALYVWNMYKLYCNTNILSINNAVLLLLWATPLALPSVAKEVVAWGATPPQIKKLCKIV